MMLTVIRHCTRIQSVVRGNRVRREIARRKAAPEPTLAVPGENGATLIYIGLDQNGLSLHDPVTLKRVDFPGTEPGSRQVARLHEISPLPSDTLYTPILDKAEEIMGYTLQLTMLGEFANGCCLRCETNAALDIIVLLQSLLEARGKQANPNSHVSHWDEEHQVHGEPRPFSELFSRRTYRLANFKNNDWHHGEEKYATPLKSATLRKLAAMEKGLGDGVRPKVAPLAIGDSDSDEEKEEARDAGVRVGGSQTPTLPPISC
jgi:hypothetical protein